MASNDHQLVAGSLVQGVGVAAGITRGSNVPNGADPFVFEARALTGAGTFALRSAPQGQPEFDPLTKGGVVSLAMKASAGAAAFGFLGLQNTTVASSAYMLGLSDDGHVELVKGTLDGTSRLLLARGSNAFAPGTWVHLRLEVVCNLNGDCVLNATANDLAQHTVASPVWTAIPGFAVIGATLPGAAPGFVLVDDLAAINSGSLPYIGGRAGFGARFSAANQSAAFGRFALVRQT